jgi:hypothetical protein
VHCVAREVSHWTGRARADMEFRCLEFERRCDGTETGEVDSGSWMPVLDSLDDWNSIRDTRSSITRVSE